MKIRVKLLFVIAMITAIVGFGMFLLLFIKGEELLPKTHAYIPIERIDMYTEITRENFNDLFQTKEVLRAAVVPSMITMDRREEVMNKMFVSPLHEDEFLSVYHVADSMLVPREGEMAYPIPNDWWSVIDWTGRIGDVGDIWLTPSDSLKRWYEQQHNLRSRVDDPSHEWMENQGNDVTPSFESRPVEIIRSTLVPELPERPLREPVFRDVRIRYVFDSSNRAIRNATGIDDRSEATGNPNNVNLFLTEEEYSMIKTAVEDGYQLILAVRSGVER